MTKKKKKKKIFHTASYHHKVLELQALMFGFVAVTDESIENKLILQAFL